MADKGDTTTPASYTFTSYEKNDVQVNLKVNAVSPVDSAKYKVHRMACLVLMVLLNLGLLGSAIGLMVTSKTCVVNQEMVLGKHDWWKTSLMATFDFNTDFETFKTNVVGHNALFINNFVQMNNLPAYKSDESKKLTDLTKISDSARNNFEVIINLGDIAHSNGLTADYFFVHGSDNFIDYSKVEARRDLLSLLKPMFAKNVKTYAISTFPRKPDTAAGSVRDIISFKSIINELRLAIYDQTVNFIYTGSEALTDEESNMFILTMKTLSIDNDGIDHVLERINAHKSVINEKSLTTMQIPDSLTSLSLFIPYSLIYPLRGNLNIENIKQSRSKLTDLWKSNAWVITKKNSLLVSKLTVNNVVKAVIIFNSGASLVLAEDTIDQVALSSYKNLNNNNNPVGTTIDEKQAVVVILQ